MRTRLGCGWEEYGNAADATSYEGDFGGGVHVDAVSAAVFETLDAGPENVILDLLSVFIDPVEDTVSVTSSVGIVIGRVYKVVLTRFLITDAAPTMNILVSSLQHVLPSKLQK